MRIGRRRFVLGTLSGIWLSLSITGVSGCSSSSDTPAFGAADIKSQPYSPEKFPHGIASGDPLADRVILWTRMPATADSSATVHWVVTSDPELKNIVASGTAVVAADKDFTVKVDATGLSPATTYYYAFGVQGGRTTTGRTRTLPTGDVDRVRLAFTSCANYNNG